jgi:hypothetical protein
MSFEAKYPGGCAACGEEVRGTMVTFDATRSLVHDVCPEALPAKPLKVCPGCNMALPATGRCDDCD